ncbi:efflux RND transporter periplasmic adaptor subunit [Microvirga brassicacearum]|uniref:Efflux RND transporter periplasmic adaptor subunit n=2 Tax=Microvirga brassicacearum TaxID=2580413 RepID=A0A5N3PA70_9HYPH|nr:efflux RND transporter periplasmic adaptor subunit [Microvirga brassicacearum]
MPGSPKIGLMKPLGAVAVVVVAGVVASSLMPNHAVSESNSTGRVAQATPVSVAVVEARHVATWEEFSGRLEAVGRVEVRSRVAGAVQAIHFREGSLVEKGALLVTIDPEPYAAEVERADAQVVAAEARLSFAQTELDRGLRMTANQTITQRDLDSRMNGVREAEANLRAAKAAAKSSRLNLSYTEIRAPISGRVGKAEITVGNLVAAGPGAPVLTVLVSVDPIYASFDADENVVQRALDTLSTRGDRRGSVADIPVEMTLGSSATVARGKLQLIDHTVDAASGTVGVRAVFDNPDGRLMPGQFTRIRLGHAKTTPALLVSERAVGVDQDKKFVLVVDADLKAVYREVKLGAPADGLRVVTSGLAAGERVVVNGLHRVRPGALIAPQPVPMEANATGQFTASTVSSSN